MICVSIGRGRHKMMKAEHRHLAEQGVKIVELRLDYIRRSINIKRLLRDRPCPIIATCRRPQDGGQWEGNESDRIVLLRTAIADGVDYIDIEEDIADQIPRYGATKRIISYHNFQETPDTIEEVHERMGNLDADIIKIATMANNPSDNLRVLRLCRGSEIPTIAFCMGEIGTPSRILCGRFGAPFTYATFHHERTLAPGQLSYKQMRETYRYEEVDEETEFLGVIADPVGHSLSPLIHNSELQRHEMNKVYIPFRVPRECLDEFMRDCQELGITGLSVTIPHKESVLKCCTSLDEDVAGIRAANTVIFNGKTTYAHNTDCKAAITSIARAIEATDLRKPFAGLSALIMGSGGAAKAIAFGLQRGGASVTLTGRSLRKTEMLADHLKCKSVDWVLRHQIKTNILINCTPVGMHPNVDETPFDKNHLQANIVVFDCVYNPEQTLLIKQAREQGCKVISGVEMFVRQAAMQFKLFTGEDADKKAMRKEIKRAISAASY